MHFAGFVLPLSLISDRRVTARFIGQKVRPALMYGLKTVDLSNRQMAVEGGEDDNADIFTGSDQDGQL